MVSNQISDILIITIVQTFNINPITLNSKFFLLKNKLALQRAKTRLLFLDIPEYLKMWSISQEKNREDTGLKMTTLGIITTLFSTELH